MSGNNQNPSSQHSEKEENPKVWITKGVAYPILVEIDSFSGEPLMETARDWDGLTDGEKVFYREKGFYYGNWEENEEPIRKLNKEELEIWSRAIFNATLVQNPFSPALAVLSPGRDRNSGTIYTDADARVGIGDKFFYEWDDRKRITAVLHEALHVLYSHFDRFKRISFNPNQLMNIAADFEINGALKMVRSLDISMGVHPEDKINVSPDHPWFPMNGKPMWGEGLSVGKTMEEYYSLLEKQAPKQNGEDDNGNGEGQGGQQAGSGQCPVHGQGGNGDHEHGNEGESGNGSACSCQGWSCGSVSEEKSQELDDAGVKGSSDTEKEIARSNTRSNIIEEKKKSRSYGSGSNDAFLDIVLEQLEPPKVPWQSIFRQIISRSLNSITAGRTDYSFRRSNRRMSNSRYIFPGTVAYVPMVDFGIDTSGSMSKSDYMALLKEAEQVIKNISQNGKGMRVFSVDTKIENIQRVSSVEDIDLRGGGGTDMGAAFKYLNELPLKERPDLFVLATDGYIPFDSVLRELEKPEASYKTVILITSADAFEHFDERISDLVNVIDVSPDDDDFRR